MSTQYTVNVTLNLLRGMISMPVKVVVGAQFGDEGKGKMVDWLAKDADLVVRFQGGDNAGHTVINEFGIFKLPSADLTPKHRLPESWSSNTLNTVP